MGSGHITKNRINLELIEIIQFFLKISDLLRHSHLWFGVWVVEWISGLMDGLIDGSMVGTGQTITKLNKSGSNQDNSILFEDL